MDDLTVVKRCLEGRNESFTHIVTRYKDRIFRYITSFVYDREEARDLAQETFVKAFRYLASYDPARPFSSWLFRIARNTAIDYIKSVKRRPDRVTVTGELGDGDEDRSAAAKPLSVEERVEKREMNRLILQAVKKLPEVYRSSMMLRYYGNCSYQEIADTLEVPIGTVKFRLNKGKWLLKEALGRHLDEPLL